MSTLLVKVHKSRKDRVTPTKVVIAALMLAVGAFILAYQARANSASNRVFLSYWAAGTQLVHLGNPYDAAKILSTERSAGFAYTHPYFMRNPPTVFFLVAPLGLFTLRVASVLWSYALIVALMASIRMIWKLQGSPEGRLHLLGYSFPPAIACLTAGQIGIFLLLGVTAFLYFYQSKPYLAGAALILSISLKPHLFIPFSVAFLMWAVSRKAYAVLLGAAGALTTTLMLAFFLDPSGWVHYSQMIAAEGIGQEFIPTLSLIFRLYISESALWLQSVPAVLACLWIIWFFRRRPWEWMKQGQLALLVSMLVAPYAWLSDQTILLPAILLPLSQTTSMRPLVLYLIAVGICFAQIFSGANLHSVLYLWTAPAWLGWYLFANHSANKGVAAAPPPDGAAITI